MIQISIAELHQSLETFAADAKDFLVDTKALIHLKNNLVSFTSGSPSVFTLEIAESNPLITKPAPKKFTYKVGDEIRSVVVHASITAIWNCRGIPLAKKNKPATHLTVEGLATSKCVFMAEVDGEHVPILQYHADIQALDGPGPSLHFQLSDNVNAVGLDVPRLISSQVHVIDFMDMVIGELFGELWSKRTTTARDFWLGPQKRRLAAIFDLYRQTCENSGFNGLRSVCAHKHEVKL